MPQRKKIFRARWKVKLEQNPIEIEVDGKKIRFRHLNSAGGEVPSARRLLWQALDNMQTKDDWQKLPRLLEALYFNANSRFEHSDWPKIVRKASMSGNLGPIFDSMRNPTKTGLKLNSSETIQEVMSAIVWEAASAGWTPAATERAFKNADKVVQYMHQDEHQLGTQAGWVWAEKGRHPLKKDPQFLSVPLLLASMMVARHGKAAEYLPLARKYAIVVVERWPENKGLLELHPNEAYIDPEGMAYLVEKNKFLQVASPILRGFDLAIEALGGQQGLDGQIRARRNALAEEVQSALTAEETQGKRGRAVHEKCFVEPQAQKAKKQA